jgi:hypothetical protein
MCTRVRCYYLSAAVKVIALIASGRDQGFTATVSRSYVPRCWVRGFVKSCDVSTSESNTHYSDREVSVSLSSSEFLKISK